MPLEAVTSVIILLNLLEYMSSFSRFRSLRISLIDPPSVSFI